MAIKPPLLAQLVSDPTSPHEKIILPQRDRELAKLSDLKGWHNSLDRYAAETAAGGKPQHVLDFKGARTADQRARERNRSPTWSQPGRQDLYQRICC